MSGGERRRVALAAQLVRTWTCSSSTSRPTTSTSRASRGWPSTCGPAPAHSSSSPTTAGSSTRSARPPGRSSTAACTPTRAATRRTCSPAPSGRGSPTVTEERRHNLARKELAWLRRGPPARTSKPRYRIEAAEALIADVPPPRDSVALKGFAARRLGKTVYDVEDVDYAVPTDDGAHAVRRPHLARRAGRPDRHRRRERVGQDHAAAGAGRARRSPTPGTVVVGPDRAVGYLSQDVAELPPRAAGARGRAGGRPRSRGSATRRSRRRRWPSGSGSPRTASGRRSATCPVASAGGCSCCGC